MHRSTAGWARRVDVPRYSPTSRLPLEPHCRLVAGTDPSRQTSGVNFGANRFGRQVRAILVRGMPRLLASLATFDHRPPPNGEGRVRPWLLLAERLVGD